MIRRSATVTQNAWLEIIFSKTVCSLMPTTSSIRTPPPAGVGAPTAPPVASGCMDGSRYEARHLFRTGVLDRLLGHLAPAAHDKNPVGDGKDVGHAVADQDDRDPLIAQTPNEV